MIDGPTLLCDALVAGVEVDEVFAAPNADPDAVAAAVAHGARVHEVPQDVLARAVDTVTPQGMAAIARRREISLGDAVARAAHGPLALVLIDVGDPGNAGTLLRGAEAAGAAVVLFCGSSVDPTNGKCVRASAGALFHLAVAIETNAATALAALRAQGVRTVAAVVDQGTPYDRCDLVGPVAVVVGSEAHGLTPPVLAAVDQLLTIPMAGRAESLNVAMAGTLLCFESLRQRRARDAAVVPQSIGEPPA